MKLVHLRYGFHTCATSKCTRRLCPVRLWLLQPMFQFRCCVGHGYARSHGLLCQCFLDSSFGTMDSPARDGFPYSSLCCFVVAVAMVATVAAAMVMTLQHLL